MQTFISEILNDILKTQNSFEDVVFILPSQRAKVFVKQELKSKISLGFFPKIKNIEEFIAEVSQVQQIDNIQLLFEFYTVYKSIEEHPDTFDVFSSWATTVLQDFNEIDQHLVDAKDIFLYIRDIERLKKWSVKGTFKETELIKNHHSFLEKLHQYYVAFYNVLKTKNIGYQGLLYRESCKKIDNFLANNKTTTFYFIGFNALNKAEELLFKKVLSDKKSNIYWDIDTSFLESNHLAGKFIRKYKREWQFYEKSELKLVGNEFSKGKKIEITGAAKNITQLKYVGELLSNKENIANTALVLADESLLPVAINSLPKNIDAINITMGYPLKDMPVSHLFLNFFQLFSSQEKLQKKQDNLFYFKDVITFLKQPFIYKFLTNVDDIVTDIAKNNITFISVEKIVDYLKNEEKVTQALFVKLFSKFITIDDFLERIIVLITVLKEQANSLEKEYLFRYYTIFNQLKTYHNTYNYFTDLKNLAHFFKQIVNNESVSFQGEPLRGLQLMGMLETRVLDFENIILVSANEGVLPANFQKQTFIPFDVKVAFELPTYREKDAIFSYHFFRLLQRAKNIQIIYNTENDSFGSGEKSRFVTQLELLKEHQQKKIVPEIVTNKVLQKEIRKNTQVSDRLKEIAKEGISPSSLTTYLRNPFSFYKQKVLKIKEFDDVEETIAANTLGTVVHEVLDELYTPFVGKFITEEVIKEMQKKTLHLVEKHFKIYFKNGDITTGKNRLIFEVAHRFVQNFLKQEIEIVKNSENSLKIIATEDNLATEISIDGLDFPIKIHGKVDRVDELNGVLRIIDYKTGMVKSSNLKVTDFENLRDENYHKAIQVLLYAFLYTKSKKVDINKTIEAGVFSFKNLNTGFLAVDFSSNYRNPDCNITTERLDEFMTKIKKYIQDLYNKEISFLEPEDAKY